MTSPMGPGPGSPGGVPGGYGGPGPNVPPGVPTSGAAQVGGLGGLRGDETQPTPTVRTPPASARPRDRGTATGAPGVSGGTGAQPLRSGKARRARLVLRRVDPWSVLKFTLLFSLCLLIVFVVAVAALFYALEALGVFESVNEFVRDLTQANSGGQRTGGVEVPFTASRVIGVAGVIGLINVVLITAISTLGAFLYNLCADIVGGIEVTLAERD